MRLRADEFCARSMDRCGGIAIITAILRWRIGISNHQETNHAAEIDGDFFAYGRSSGSNRSGFLGPIDELQAECAADGAGAHAGRKTTLALRHASAGDPGPSGELPHLSYGADADEQVCGADRD